MPMGLNLFRFRANLHAAARARGLIVSDLIERSGLSARTVCRAWGCLDGSEPMEDYMPTGETQSRLAGAVGCILHILWTAEDRAALDEGLRRYDAAMAATAVAGRRKSPWERFVNRVFGRA
jgi:hypothetical protein